VGNRRRHYPVLTGCIPCEGRRNNAAELARLKGELEALEQVANQKNCGLRVQGRN
jgi:hypothetical protein